MYLKTLKNMLNEMPENTDEEIKNKLLIALYILQPPLNILFDNIALYLKKPKFDINNYFIIRNKSWVLHINSLNEKKIIKYNKIHNPEIYKILKLVKHSSILFNSNTDVLFNNIIKERLNCDVKIDDIPKILVNDLINSSYYKGMSSTQKEQAHKKIFGFSISVEYAKVNLVEF